MAKVFNVTGACIPGRHYMVNLEQRLDEIKAMVDLGQYFTINRARQYGKTTILRALAEFLQNDYVAVGIDFQKIESEEFANGSFFVHALAREIYKKVLRRGEVPESVKAKLAGLAGNMDSNVRMAELFGCFSEWCELSEKPVVLIIDEVDTASNNQVFLDFLAQLRADYLDREDTPAFQSVILAGVYDVRNIKRKIRPDGEEKENSPWNISARFRVEMEFSVKDIQGMLDEYERDYHTGMDTGEMAKLLYDYTSGYPFLVSWLCKCMDEEIAGSEAFPSRGSAWTKAGFLEAEKILLNEKTTLFESLVNKLNEYPKLRTVVHELLFTGKPIPYMALNQHIDMALMLGFIKNEGGNVVIFNRIFETLLYNLFISDEYLGNRLYDAGGMDKNHFIVEGHLDVRRILEKFVEIFDSLYGDQNEEFLEQEGRKYFMLFLKPIINGVGNCYVEAETRNRERMDLVIDYRGEQSIIELKVWRGNAYHERGEAQLLGYLDYFQLRKGYMLSFNFNKKKEIGLKEIHFGDRLLIEAVV